MIVRKARNGVYWQLWWVVDGKRHVESIGKLTERDAERKRQDKAIELDKNPALAAGTGSMTIGAWFDRNVENRRGDLSAATVEDILTTKAVLLKHFKPEQLIGDVTKTHAVGFYNWLKTRKRKPRAGETEPKPIAVATVRKHMRNCKTLWSYAAEVPEVTGVKLNPFKQKGIKSGVPKMQKDWQHVTEDDFKKLSEACPSAAWRCMFALCHYAMLRSNEARSLRWRDVDWSSPARLKVAAPTDEHGRTTEDTTKKHERTVPIVAELLPILREAFENSLAEGPCHELPEDANEISKGARAIVTASGVPNYGPPLHTLRGSCISRWVNKYPAPKVAAFAGHSIQVMHAHYVKPSEDDFAMIAGDDKARRIAELKAELAQLTGGENAEKPEDVEEVPF